MQSENGFNASFTEKSYLALTIVFYKIASQIML